MARGKEYTSGEREKAYALYGVGESITAISKKLKIPQSTIRSWIKKQPDDEFAELRAEKMRARTRGYIEQADEIIDTGMEILAGQFRRALEKQEELDSLMSEIARDEDMGDKQKSALIKKLGELSLTNVRDVTIAIATIYDKRELAKGRSEEKETGGVIILPEVKEKE